MADDCVVKIIVVWKRQQFLLLPYNYSFYLVDFMMLWSLLRSGTQRGFSWNTPFRFQRSRLSGLCKTSTVRFDGISSHFRHGPQRRLICTRCYRELDIGKGSITQHARCLKVLSSLLPNVNRRFVGTRVSLNSNSTPNMRNKTTAIYTIAIVVAVVGLSYLAVPLYRLYCQVSQWFMMGQFVKWILLSLPYRWDWKVVYSSSVVWGGSFWKRMLMIFIYV